MRGLSVIAPFAPLIAKLILFSGEANEENRDMLDSFWSLLDLVKIAKVKYNGSTCITCALQLALQMLDENPEAFDTVILITDEQANVTSEYGYEMELIRRLLDKGIIVIVINPTPYPVKITDIRDKRIIYVPAMNPEAVLAALRLAQIRRTSPDAHELLVKIRTKIRKKKRTDQV